MPEVGEPGETERDCCNPLTIEFIDRLDLQPLDAAGPDRWATNRPRNRCELFGRVDVENPEGIEVVSASVNPRFADQDTRQ